MDHAKRKADRLRVMKAIFDEADGSERVHVAPGELLEPLGLTDLEMADACKYLEGERLIESTAVIGTPYPAVVRLTHWGIKEIEQSLDAPEEPTEHFPPAISVIHIEGDVIGSPIQSGSPGASQVASTGDINTQQLRDFVAAYDEQAEEFDFEPETKQVLRAHVDTIRAQASSPRPSRDALRAVVGPTRRILEGASGNVAAAGLLELLNHISF